MSDADIKELTISSKSAVGTFVIRASLRAVNEVCSFVVSLTASLFVSGSDACFG